MKKLIIILLIILLIFAISKLLKPSNKPKNLFGITIAPVFNLNNLNFQFVTPYFNNRKVVLSGNYNITDTTHLANVFSGWGGTLLLLGLCSSGSQILCSNITTIPGASKCEDPDPTKLCYPNEITQYSFDAYINDIYIREWSNPSGGYWGVNYNILNAIKSITNIQDPNVTSFNFPYNIQRIEISFSLNENNTRKYINGNIPVFKFNIIIPDCIENFWNKSECINNKMSYNRTLFSGNYCPNIVQSKTENCVPPNPDDCTTTGCYIGYIKEDFKYIGCLRYPTTSIPANSIWTNIIHTYTRNSTLINTTLLNYINGDNETREPIPINKAIPLIKSKYPGYKYIFTTFAEGDTTIIYYLVGNTLETDTIKLETTNPACSVLNSGIHSGYYIGCKSDNLDIICNNRKINGSVTWAVYDTTLSNCRSCEYGKDINYTTNSCDFTCSLDNYYFDGTGCSYNNDITKKVNASKTGVEDKCPSYINSYYNKINNNCAFCSIIENVNSTKDGCDPKCSPTISNYYNTTSKLCVSCRSNQKTQYTIDQQKTFPDNKNNCINICNSLQNLSINFVSPGNKILLAKKFDISNNTISLAGIFSAWSGSLLFDNRCDAAGAPLPCCISNDASQLTNCIPNPKNRYKFKVFINNTYVMEYSSPGYWDSNYNILTILLTAFGLDPNIYNYSNFPYTIDRIDISYSIDANNKTELFTVEYDGTLQNIFKFNIITSGSNFFASGICQKCTNPAFITNQNGDCTQACPTNNYLDQTTYRCATCPNWQIINGTQTNCVNKCTDPLKIWNNTTLQCDFCPNTGLYTYINQNKCVTPCPDKSTYYDTVSGTCRKCPYWKTSNSTQTGCINKCTGTIPYNPSTSKCDGICVPNSIYDSNLGFCKPTVQECSYCSDTPDNRCVIMSFFGTNSYFCAPCGSDGRSEPYNRSTTNPYECTNTY